MSGNPYNGNQDDYYGCDVQCQEEQLFASEQLSAPVRVIYVNERMDAVIVAEFPHREASKITAMSDWIHVALFTHKREDWELLNNVFAWEQPLSEPITTGALEHLRNWATAEIWAGERP